MSCRYFDERSQLEGKVEWVSLVGQERFAVSIVPGLQNPQLQYLARSPPVVKDSRVRDKR